MTLDQLQEALIVVVDYNYSDELDDALQGAREGDDVSEGGRGSHVIYALMTLADFLGIDTSADRAELAKAIEVYDDEEDEE